MLVLKIPPWLRHIIAPTLPFSLVVTNQVCSSFNKLDTKLIDNECRDLVVKG